MMLSFRQLQCPWLCRIYFTHFLHICGQHTLSQCPYSNV